MASVPVYVGLDYHQDSIQVCVMDAEAKILLNRSCANDVAAVKEPIVAVGGSVRLVAIEACTGAADFAEALADRSGWSVSLAVSALPTSSFSMSERRFLVMAASSLAVFLRRLVSNQNGLPGHFCRAT